jgi:hypothetical protein
VGGPLALHLLGRDVVERAHELPGLGQALLADSLGEAEVGEEGVVTPADEDVLRLDVAVDQAGLVRRIERLGDRCEDPDRPAGIQLPRHDHVLQVRPSDQPHGDEHALVAVAGLVDGDDVRVVDVRLELPLAPKALAEQDVVAQVRREHLERHRPVERDLLRLVYDAHPALAEDPGDPVPGESRALLEDPAVHFERIRASRS